jgi:cytochrome c556
MDEKWHAAAKAMSDAGVAALKAGEARNFEAVVAANGQLAEACEACHKQFKPELPSEGLIHKHVH